MNQKWWRLALVLPAISVLVKIERLRETGVDPFALETCYPPASEFAESVKAPLGRLSLFSTLEHEYGVDLAYGDEEVERHTLFIRRFR